MNADARLKELGVRGTEAGDQSMCRQAVLG